MPQPAPGIGGGLMSGDRLDGGSGCETVGGDRHPMSVASGDGGGLQPEVGAVREDDGSGGEDLRESYPDQGCGDSGGA